jgi:hypothetical protein
MGNTLLLTATITPPAGVPGLRRTDPHQRLDDYCRALDFYCRLPQTSIHRIVFIENSETDLSPLREVARQAGALDRVIFISFNGLDHPAKYGRGYGEFKLLDYAVNHSSALAGLDDNERLWKITGRYRVLNLLKLIRKAPAAYDLYCDTRDRPMPWLDLRIFSCTLGGYRKLLLGLYPQLREDVIHMAPERFLQPRIGQLAQSNRIIVRFRREPRINGIRGWDSKNYASGMNLLKYCVRSIGRRFQSGA